MRRSCLFFFPFCVSWPFLFYLHAATSCAAPAHANLPACTSMDCDLLDLLGTLCVTAPSTLFLLLISPQNLLGPCAALPASWAPPLAAALHKPSPIHTKTAHFFISNAPHLPCRLELARCIQPHRFLRDEPIFCSLECINLRSFLFLVSPNEAVPYRVFRPRCQIRVMEG